MLQRILLLFMIVALSFSLFSLPISAFKIDEAKASVQSYFLYDIKNNVTMAEKNSYKTMSSSSTVKIMTACIVLESNIDLKKEIIITEQMLKNTSGRTMELGIYDKLTVGDLLYAMLCGGYNDATVALALSVSNSLGEFVERMNNKAKSLGMNTTRYTDVTGINRSATTTVQDLAILAKYMAENEKFVEICSTKNYRFSDIATCKYTNISNRSSLLSIYKGLANFNTGSGEDGQCAIVYYKSNDSLIISIVMNASSNNKNDKENYAEAYTKQLLSHAINDYSTVTVKNAKEIIASLPVKYSISNTEIDLYLKEDIKLFLPKNIDINSELTYSITIYGNELKAPINNGDAVGVFTVSYNGIVLSTTPILSSANVERNVFLYIMDMMRSFITSIWFIIIILSILLCILLVRSKKKRKFRKMKRRRKNKSKIIKK